MVGVLNGKKGKAVCSGFVVAFLLCGVFGGLVTQQSLASNAVLFEDEVGWFGSVGSYTSLTADYAVYHSGALSYRIDVNSSGSGEFYKTYSGVQDWSGYDIINWWWYGNESNAALVMNIYDGAWDKHIAYTFYDSYRGWHLYSYAFGDGYNVSLNMALVRIIQFTSLDASNRWYIDYMYLSSEEVVDSMSLGISGWGGMVVSLFLICVCLVLALKSKSWAVNFLFGLGTVGFLGWVFANATVEVYGGWLMYMVLLSAVLALTKGAVLVRASGV